MPNRFFFGRRSHLFVCVLGALLSAAMEDMMKGPSETARSHNSLELANAIAVTEKQGTHGDEVDMDRMGKLQVLRVRSNKLSGKKTRS